jgi:hypothetical protein
MEEMERRYRRLLDEIAAEFPRFRLIPKDRSLLQRSIARLLAVVTLGAQRSYLDGYVTTIGQRVYVTPDWDQRDPGDRWATLRHERVHMRQFRRWGLLPLALGYLLLPLPFGLAYVRMRIERPAYEESVRAAAELYGVGYVCDAAFRARILAMFTSGAYGWMWPFPRALDRWYDRLVASLDEGDEPA